MKPIIAALALAALQSGSAPVPPPPAAAGEADGGDWRPIPDDELLVMVLANGARVWIRLAPRLAPEHVANIRLLARLRWWDNTSVYRVQDNWVAQWGGQPADAAGDPANKRLPGGVRPVPAAEYDAPAGTAIAQPVGADAYAPASGISADGWALASAGGATWPAHCYGTVAVARDAAPDTGSGSELFMPLGGSARRLDRNYILVGRVIEGAGALSGLPRSGAAMGFYATPAERTTITSVRLGSDLPPAERPRFAYRAADNERFAAMIAARRHPAGMTASGGIDVCDVPLAVKRLR